MAMMSERWKIVSGFFALFLTDISLISGLNATCLDTKPLRIPMNSIIFSDVFDGDKTVVQYLCDLMTGSDGIQGEDFVTNTCKDGIWDFDDYDLPDCNETKSWCFSEYSFGYGNICYRWIPTIDWETSEYLCSKYSGSHLAVIYAERIIKAMRKFLKQEFHVDNKIIFWVGLRKIKEDWSWIRTPESNDWRSLWLAGHPREGATTAALLYPDMKLYTPTRNWEKSYFNRLFALCEIDVSETMYPQYRKMKRLHVLKKNEDFNIEVPGGLLQTPYMIIYGELPPMKDSHKDDIQHIFHRGLSELRRLFAKFEAKIIDKKYSELAMSFQYKRYKATTYMLGLGCDRGLGKDKPMHGIIQRRDGFQYYAMSLSEYPHLNEFPSFKNSFCSLNNSDTVRISIVKDANFTLSDTETSVISDWTTGMFQEIYIYVIGDDGWSLWTAWSYAPMLSKFQKDLLMVYEQKPQKSCLTRHRSRVCGAAFDRKMFPNINGCGGRRSHIQRRSCSKGDDQRADYSSELKENVYDVSGPIGGSNAEIKPEETITDVIHTPIATVIPADKIHTPDATEIPADKIHTNNANSIEETHPDVNDDYNPESSGMACIYCYNYHAFLLWLIISCTLQILSRIQY